MVSIGNVSMSSPTEAWLGRGIIIDCEFKSSLDECIVEIKGLLLAEDGKIIGRLEEIPGLSPKEASIGSLMASKNKKYEEHKGESISHFKFLVPLSGDAIDHIECLRDNNPRHNVIFTINFGLKYLFSKVCTSHLYGIMLSSLPRTLKTYLKDVRLTKGVPPDALVVYDYDPQFETQSGNMWILSGNEGPKFLDFRRSEIQCSKTIHYDEWISDFLPVIRSYEVVTLEIHRGKMELPQYKHLAKAVEDLKLGENELRRGNYNRVILTLRNIVLNHLLIVENEENVRDLNDKLKATIIENVPQNLKNEYKEALSGIEKILRSLMKNHINKFVHQDTGKFINHSPKGDAEYLFLNITSIVRYLTKLSLTQSS